MGSARCLLHRPNFPAETASLTFGGFLALLELALTFWPTDTPSLDGAVAYYPPIGHALGRWSLAAGSGTISKDRSPVFLSAGRLDKTRGNGTGYFVAGLDLGSIGSLAGDFIFLGGLGDNVSTLQFSPLAKSMVQWSVGCKDLGGSAGASGESSPGDDRTNRSFFGAVTCEVQEGVYATGGIGTRRFPKGLCQSERQSLEEFQCPCRRRTAEITIFLGMAQSYYAALSLVASF